MADYADSPGEGPLRWADDRGDGKPGWRTDDGWYDLWEIRPQQQGEEQSMSDPYSDYMPEFSKPMTQGLYDAMRQAGDLDPEVVYVIAGPITSSSWVRRVRYGVAYRWKERRELQAYARRRRLIQLREADYE